MADALTAFAMKNFRSGSTYYDWSTISSSSKNFGCGYYNGGENWTVAVRVTVNDYIDRVTCRFCMTIDNTDWGSGDVTWNYKIFNSESALNAAANYSTSNKGDGTVTWNRGYGQTTTFNVWTALAAGTYYILFWRTGNNGCEIRWCNSSGNSTYYSAMTATSAERYTISYNANGGSGAPSSQQKIKGFALTLSSTKPTRGNSSAASYRVTFDANGGSCSTAYLDATRTTSYAFSKWNTDSSGTGTSYNSGASYTANAAATLYAVWSSSTSTSAITLPSASRNGYTFKGWSTSDSASSGSTGSYTPSGSVTLYATWSANTYELTIDPNGGTYNGSTELSHITGLSYDTSHEINAMPIRNGYTFSGWQSSGSGNITSGGSIFNSTVVTQTQKTDTDGTAYTNYKMSQDNTGTGSIYGSITFFYYNFTAGHTYQVSYDIRVNSISNLTYCHLRHSAFQNNWAAPNQNETEVHGWEHKTLERTFQSTTTQDGTTYTTGPCVELYAVLPSGTSGNFDIDIKNIYVYDVTDDTFAISKSDIKNGASFYVLGDTTVKAIWSANGLVYVDNGSSFDAYQVFIDNGTSWDQYIPYVDNGTSWDILS